VQYEIEVGGRLLQVVVSRTGDGFAVSVDGKTRHVDATRIDGQMLSLIVDSVWSKEVNVAADPAGGPLMVHIGTTPVPVTVNGRRRWGRKNEGAGAGSGPQRLVAPMPGKIVRVLAKPGDTIAARQPLVVVEAMKMENELRASRDGRVGEVHVAEGMSVEAGALLLVIQ
jgi:biotin carboxyl carrier protein